MFDMRRREFITLLGAAAAGWPFAARGQEAGSARRIGYLTLASGPTLQHSGAFERGLQERGYRLGKDVTIEYRWGAGRMERLPALAREVVQLNPDVIVVAATPVVQAVKNATATIPIVIAHSADPVQTGFVTSLARPGGNITGLSSITLDLAPKRLELLRELLPGMTRAHSWHTAPIRPRRCLWSRPRLRRTPSACGFSVCP
jgi:putative tryptophan/tyrosine transport system substrate-binding protein